MRRFVKNEIKKRLLLVITPTIVMMIIGSVNGNKHKDLLRMSFFYVIGLVSSFIVYKIFILSNVKKLSTIGIVIKAFLLYTGIAVFFRFTNSEHTNYTMQNYIMILLIFMVFALIVYFLMVNILNLTRLTNGRSWIQRIYEKCFLKRNPSYEMKVLVLIFFMSILLNYSNDLLIFYGTLFFFSSLIGIIVFLQNQEFNKGAIINFINLDYEDMLTGKIYYDIFFTTGDVRVFKITLDSIFPENAINSEIKVLNCDFVDKFHTVNDESKTRKYFYFTINNIEYMRNRKLKLIISYQQRGKKYKYRYDLYLETKLVGNEKVIASYFLKYCRAHVIFGKEIKAKYSEEDYRQQFILMLNSSHKYEKTIMEGENTSYFMTQKLYDSRKWFLHDGPFGFGKSSLDITFLSNAGYYPIVISPWESNYDNDILYLIYDKVLTETHVKPSFCNKSTIFFWIALLLALITLFHGIIDFLYRLLVNIDYTKALLDVELELSLTKFKLSDIFDGQIRGEAFIYSVSFLISLLLTKRLLPNVVIHVKNSSKIHQSYYVKGIQKAINQNKVMLLIEDIDRLSEEAALNTFRILSSLNGGFLNRRSPIGILSYDQKYIKHKDELKNKIVYDTIFDELSFESSKELYFIDYLHAVMKVDGNEVEKEKLKHLYKKIVKNINFRDIHVLLNAIVNQEEKMRKVEITVIENEIDNFNLKQKKSNHKRNSAK